MKARFSGVLILCAMLCVTLSASAFATVPNTVDLTQEPKTQSFQTVTKDVQRYAVSVKAQNAKLTVRINDIPVVFKIFRDTETLDVSFNEWLKRGINVVEFNVERFDQLNTSALSYNVYYQSPTQLVSGDKLVLFQSPADVSMPVRQQVGIRSQTVPILRVWQTDELDISPAEQGRLLDAINSFRSRLNEAINRSDNAYLATYDKPIRDEIDRAYGRIAESEDDILKHRRELAERLKGLLNAALVSSPELRLSDLNFEMIGDKHLVKVSRLDGAPLIDVARGDLHFVIDKPVYGSIGGIWEMLRQ